MNHLYINIFIIKKALFVITLAWCCLNSNAQEFKYYDLNSVQKDTTEYLYKNFVQQKSYFVNKKLKEFLKYQEKDFEVGTAIVGTTSPYIDPEGKEYVEDIYIFWNDYDSWTYLFENHYDWFTTIHITFKSPYTLEEEQFYERIPDGKFTESMKAHLLNDFIIQDIKIYGKYVKK